MWSMRLLHTEAIELIFAQLASTSQSFVSILFGAHLSMARFYFYYFCFLFIPFCHSFSLFVQNSKIVSTNRCRGLTIHKHILDTLTMLHEVKEPTSNVYKHFVRFVSLWLPFRKNSIRSFFRFFFFFFFHHYHRDFFQPFFRWCSMCFWPLNFVSMPKCH